MSMSKKTKITGTVVATITAALLLVSGGKKDISIDYNIYSKNEYVTVMEIDAPEEASIDIAVLYLNGEEVGKTLLPDGKFESIPIVFEDLSRLEVKLYRTGKCVGTAKFVDETLSAGVKGVEYDA